MVGEEQHRVQRACRDQGQDFVFFLRGVTGDALATGALRTVSGRCDPFDVAAGGERDQDGFIRDKVRLAQVFDGLYRDVCAALVAILVRQFAQVILDQGQDLLRMGKQVLQVGDLCL